jgi:hypothetical protein
MANIPQMSLEHEIDDDIDIKILGVPPRPGMPFLESDTCAERGGIIYFCQGFFPCMMPSMDGWQDEWMDGWKKLHKKMTTTSFITCNIVWTPFLMHRCVISTMFGSCFSFFLKRLSFYLFNVFSVIIIIFSMFIFFYFYAFIYLFSFILFFKKILVFLICFIIKIILKKTFVFLFD